MSPSPNDVSGAAQNVSCWALLVGPGLALAMYFPTLFGTFLSDDFLVNTMLTHGAEPRLAWDSILADFSREWMGLEGGGMYRPMVSMSFAVNYWFGGSNPLWFHLVNILIHATTALLCALVCVRCSIQRPNLAAILGGALVAVHPAFAESTCWIAARNSGLQVMFASLAMLCFTHHLRSGKAIPLGLCILSFITALMTKETAVLLPFSFLALDVLLRGWQGVSRRWLHIGMFGIVGLYFLMRLLVLGVLLGGTSTGLESIQSSDVLTNLLAKGELLIAPVGSSYDPVWGNAFGYLSAAGMALLILPALLRPSTAWIPLLLATWIGLHFAPSYKLIVDTTTLSGSRLIIGAAAILSIGLSFLATRSRWPTLTNLATGCLLVGLAALSVGRMTAFLRAYDDMRSLRAELSAAAADTKPPHPVALVAANRDIDGVTFLNCNAVFPLLEKPIASQDQPFVSLGFVFQPVPNSEHLLFDVGPWRALRSMGATLFEWHRAPDTDKGLTIIDRQGNEPAQPLPMLQKSSMERGTGFLSPTPIDTWRVEALEIEVAGPCTGGRVEWLYFDAAGKAQEYSKFPEPPTFQEAPDHALLSQASPHNSNSLFYVDLSHYLTFLAVGKLGGLAGLLVTTEGAGTEVVRVRLLPRVEPLPLPKRLAGVETSLANTQEHLLAPALPAGADAMTLYLVGPDTTLSIEVDSGPVPLSTEMQDSIAVILRSSRQKRYYFYYEASGTRRWRSAVDWLVFRPR